MQLAQWRSAIVSASIVTVQWSSALAAEPPFAPATWPRTVALAAGVLAWPPPPPPPQPARANAVAQSTPRVAEIRVADVATVRASRGAGMKSLGTCRVLVKRV